MVSHSPPRRRNLLRATARIYIRSRDRRGGGGEERDVFSTSSDECCRVTGQGWSTDLRESSSMVTGHLLHIRNIIYVIVMLLRLEPVETDT